MNPGMTVEQAVSAFSFNYLAGQSGWSNIITDVYTGDLLSWVMGRAPEKAAWITIQGHVNIVAVASLTGVSCIVIAEGAEADPDTLARAESEGIPILSTRLTSYQAARLFILAGYTG